MTVLLVLFTLILFLTFDHFVERHRARVASMASEGVQQARVAADHDFPETFSLATNHTWLRKNPDGTATIGLDLFLSRLLGAVEKVSLPGAGIRTAPSMAAIGMESNGRTLRVASPLFGDIVETNPEVLRNPSLILRDPYGKGWLLRVKPRANALVQTEQFLVNRPGEWLREQLALVRDFLAVNSQQPALAAVLQEGGLPTEGVLQRFDARVWNEFGQAFAALKAARIAGVEEARS